MEWDGWRLSRLRYVKAKWNDTFGGWVGRRIWSPNIQWPKEDLNMGSDCCKHEISSKHIHTDNPWIYFDLFWSNSGIQHTTTTEKHSKYPLSQLIVMDMTRRQMLSYLSLSTKKKRLFRQLIISKRYTSRFDFFIHINTHLFH